MVNGVLNRDGKLEVRAEISVNWERQVDSYQSLSTTDLLHGVLAELRNIKTQLAAAGQTGVSWPACTSCWQHIKPPGTMFQCQTGHVMCKQCIEKIQVLCQSLIQDFNNLLNFQ